MKIWIIVDAGKTGTEHQCLGLAEAFGATAQVFRVEVVAPFSWMGWWPFWLAPYVTRSTPVLFDAAGPDGVGPDVILTAGRRSARVAVAWRWRFAPRACLIALQAPPLSLACFDWVIAPEHDHVLGKNVLSTLGALNSISPESLAVRAAPFAVDVAALPRPITGVLVGGTAKGVVMDAAFAHGLGQKLASLETGSILLTTSRRTPLEVRRILQSYVRDKPGLQYYGPGSGANPYAAILYYADTLVVTADSMSMLSEACSAGKPVYVAEVPGERRKFARFTQVLVQRGLARPFTGGAEPFDTPGLQEAQRIAALLKKAPQLASFFEP